ncbi:MAG TPA: hypothetical protein PKM55_08700, partial [Acidobacteriota bacterium]|nr:hypothetical protein [Acidobacteriota bacterium]
VGRRSLHHLLKPNPSTDQVRLCDGFSFSAIVSELRRFLIVVTTDSITFVSGLWLVKQTEREAPARPAGMPPRQRSTNQSD